MLEQSESSEFKRLYLRFFELSAIEFSNNSLSVASKFFERFAASCFFKNLSSFALSPNYICLILLSNALRSPECKSLKDVEIKQE